MCTLDANCKLVGLPGHFRGQFPVPTMDDLHPLPWKVKKTESYTRGYYTHTAWLVIDAKGNTVSKCTEPGTAHGIVDLAHARRTETGVCRDGRPCTPHCGIYVGVSSWRCWVKFRVLNTEKTEAAKCRYGQPCTTRCGFHGPDWHCTVTPEKPEDRVSRLTCELEQAKRELAAVHEAEANERKLAFMKECLYGGAHVWIPGPCQTDAPAREGTLRIVMAEYHCRCGVTAKLKG